MQETITKTISVALALFLMAVSSLAMAQQNENVEGQSEDDRARSYFSNLELINQDGETVRFYDDVLKDKVVVINFIFTNCEGACPLITHKLTLVRDRLEGYIGDPVQFVSLSLDPARDTPAALKEFAKTHHADHDGWVFLTGDPENLDHVIKRLGQFTDDMEAHSTMMLAGNVNAAHWMKIQPQEQPPQIAEKLRLLLEDNEAS
jgi:cytochrome oxidase Cu insertion factor (SCO1/SenC/PrrC family)